MSVTSGFFNSIDGDRKYDAEQMSGIFDGVINNGVFKSIGDNFVVKAVASNTASSSAITVGSGRCYFNKKWLYNDSLMTITLDTLSSNIKYQCDAVVIEIDDENRIGTIKVISGTPLTSVQNFNIVNKFSHTPSLSKTNPVFQYPIAYIVRSYNRILTQSDIKYVVGTAECPYATSILKTMSREAELEEFITEVEQIISDLVSFTTTPATTESLGPVKLLGSEYGDAAAITATGGGGLYIKNGGIYKDLIKDDAVRTRHIQDYNITTSKIYNGAVTNDKLASGAVSVNKIYDGAVTETKIYNGAVTENKIGDGAETESKLGDDVKADMNSRMSMPDFSYDTDTPVNIPVASRKNIDTFLPRINAFKSVGCIGDSLASGACYTDSGSYGNAEGEHYEYSWGQYLSRMTGNKYYNWSKSGLTAGAIPKDQTDGSVFNGLEQWAATSYATECFDGNHKCQAYIIGLGVNDSSSRKDENGNVIYDGNGYPSPNISVADFTTGYTSIINGILAANPTAKIFCLTIPSNKAEGWISPYGTGDAVQIDTFKFNDAIRSKVATYHYSNRGQVFLVDLYRDYYEYFARSGGVLAEYWRAAHGNAIAYQYCALLIGNAIERIMETNPDDFSAVEFIPYDNGELNFKAYDTRPKQVGVWIDGTPVWRVAFENKEVPYLEDSGNIKKSIYYTDGTYSMFIDYSSLSADIIHQNNEVLVIGGQCFAGFERYSASNNAYGSYVKYVGHIVDNQQFEFDGLIASANFADHETIYMTGYIEFVTPATNIQTGA